MRTQVKTHKDIYIQFFSPDACIVGCKINAKLAVFSLMLTLVHCCTVNKGWSSGKTELLTVISSKMVKSFAFCLGYLSDTNKESGKSFLIFCVFFSKIKQHRA